ncbi:MAG: hypothetical protein LBQ00_02100 [Syntrophobacterales bacterium]|nr:hypothetical protein [Syntrophobacterales bacterium]
MELFVVTDEMLMGQGVFGVFSTIEKAKVFMEDIQLRTGFRCMIKGLEVFGNEDRCSAVCVAYNHDCIHDVYLLDGLYALPWDAYEATGDRGLIVEFIIDSPEQKRTVQDF